MPEGIVRLLCIGRIQRMPFCHLYCSYSCLIFYLVFNNLLQGIGGWGGGLSEYIALDTRYVHILPEGIPCTFIADSVYHELDIDVGCWGHSWTSCSSLVRSKEICFQKGRTVLITGAGPVCHPQCLRQGLVLITVFFLDRIVSPQSFTVFPSLSC